jgi:signal transduction histidine kinase
MSSLFSNESIRQRLTPGEPSALHVGGAHLAQAIRENQALKEQVAAQTQLLHLLTHQLATPLTSLGGSVQLLGEPDLNAEQRQEFLEMVQQQVQRLRSLLQDIVALQNLETGVFATNATRVGLKPLVEEVVATFCQPPVVYQFSPALPDVWCDRWQVSQVLVNLLSNAIKYSPSGRPIEVGATLLPSGWVEVWVRDQGLGIPIADQPHLFERFYRVRHGDRQNIAGTGLGLSLCKALVENQGGRISFESAHGEGSCFYFTLPTVELAAELNASRSG